MNKFSQEIWVCDIQSSIVMGGGSNAPSEPASTTSNNTTTYIQDVPQWEQQYLTNLLGQAQTNAAQPYQQFPGQQVAGFTPDQAASFSQIENLTNANGTGTAPWQSAVNGAIGQSSAGANTANNIAASGSPYYQAAASYNPLQAIQPYTQAAANTETPQGINAYLSPYTQNVVQGLENTATQNWNQNIMPGVNDTFIGSGQFGSGRNAQVLGQAANQFQTNLDTSVANALQSGYGQASTNAANQASLLGNLANTTASATGAQAQNLQGIGSGLGNLAATQAGAQGAAATNLANTGQTNLNTGITAATALQDVGQQQQNLGQQNINTAIQNWQTQTMWPETQTGYLSDIIRGLPLNESSTTGATQTPTTTNQVGSVSPLSTLGATILGASALGGVGSVGNSTGTSAVKNGGLIRGYAEGGQVDAPLTDSIYGSTSILPPPTPDQINAAMNTYSPSNPQRSADLPSNISDLYSSSNDSSRNPLSAYLAPVLDPQQARNYQLLAMARGLLIPSHSGAEALGNGLQGYTDVGLQQAQWNAQMRQQALQFESLNAYRQGMMNSRDQRDAIAAARLSEQQQRDQDDRKYQLDLRKTEDEEKKNQFDMTKGNTEVIKDSLGNPTGILDKSTGTINPIRKGINPLTSPSATPATSPSSSPVAAQPSKYNYDNPSAWGIQ